MKNTKTKSWINLIAFLITIGFNTLGALGYINGMTQKAVSDKYHTLVTPAPFTFSIWGVIYTLVFLSLIMMIVKREDKSVKNLINIFTTPFLLSSLFNILWILTFSYEKIGISTLLIFALLISLTEINRRLIENRNNMVFRITGIAFGIYAGWLTIATVVNISAFLVSVNWDGFGIDRTIWAPVILLASLVIAIFIKSKIKNAVYPLAIAWAFFGIFKEIERFGQQVDYGTYMKPVLIVGIVVLILVSVIQFKKNNYCVIKKY